MSLRPGDECIVVAWFLVGVLCRPWTVWPKSWSSLHPWWLAQSLTHGRSSIHILLCFQSPPYHCHTTATIVVCLGPLKPQGNSGANHTHSVEFWKDAALSPMHRVPGHHSHREPDPQEELKSVSSTGTTSGYTVYLLWSSSLGFAVPPLWPQGGDIPLPMSTASIRKTKPCPRTRAEVGRR